MLALVFQTSVLHLKGQINLLHDCSKKNLFLFFQYRSELELEPPLFHGSGSSQKGLNKTEGEGGQLAGVQSLDPARLCGPADCSLPG